MNILEDYVRRLGHCNKTTLEGMKYVRNITLD
jgi:hypothetical protein